MRSTKELFLSKVKKGRKCWLWTGYKMKNGYGVGWHSGLQEKMLAHRLSWIIYNERAPADMCDCHTCDNPGCVNPKHLFLGTRSDNMQDCSRKGRLGGAVTGGEAQPTAKLTWEAVRKIRLLRGKKTQKQIADDFFVTEKTIGRIHRFEFWVEPSESWESVN